MTKVVVGAADQAVVRELRALLAEIEGTEILSIVESSHELSAMVARLKPSVVLLHDALGPQSAPDVVREIVFRSPTTGVLVLNSGMDGDTALLAMEAGAKGVVRYPMGFDDLLSRFEVARQWSERMSGLISGAVADTARDLGRHGRVTVFAGAKGGVGTTTIATHMAIDLQRKVPGTKVCLVDLDLQAGDVSGIIEARQRVSIADVAKVSEDLSAGTILDALVRHESGISLLLAPQQVHESEYVTASAVRAILGLLRQEFDVILVDGGSHATPAQAAAIEVADAAVVVVTADVLAMRSFRRSVQAWEGLGVRSEQELHVVANKVSRDDALTFDALGKLTSASVVSTWLPSAFRSLERSVNSRNPDEIREASWWSALERIGAEIGVSGASAVPTPTSEPKRRGRRRAKAEAGQVAIETVALVPVVALICLLAWQVGLTALAFVWNGHAANAATRAHAIGEDPGAAARDAVPDSMRDSVHVTVLHDGSVTVSTKVPVLCPGCAALPGEISQTSDVVEEP
ncbi:AAA family ATPase [Nocardioides sp. dk4132]|uniref:AAA family ATPase n=1 Tax=unclassified Nocardioides TaxID=2615069 RepID=UPI001294FBCB|nr:MULTISPECIES: AAA family ATPase [unclassified Nocardioides]MQW76355.1 AAA family ATPase [Nocardioides sp. dk4132]QGA07367.1 AAA family ATPase [Nocardioides sp. dk884]